MQLTREQNDVVNFIQEHGGELHSSTGLATREVLNSIPSIASMDESRKVLRELEENGFIERQVVGKRTYKISLVPNKTNSLESFSTQEIASELYSRMLKMEEEIEQVQETNYRLAARISTIREQLQTPDDNITS